MLKIFEGMKVWSGSGGFTDHHQKRFSFVRTHHQGDTVNEFGMDTFMPICACENVTASTQSQATECMSAGFFGSADSC